jgi:SPOR domain
MSLARYPLFASLLLVLLLAGCSRQEADWGKAQRADTIAAYQQYLDDYPQGMHGKDAQARLTALVDEREWQRAIRLNTPEAYQVYLGGHPDGAHAADARARISDFVLARTPTGAEETDDSESPALPPPPLEAEPPPAAAPRPVVAPPAAVVVPPAPVKPVPTRPVPGVQRGPSGTLAAIAGPVGDHRIQLGAFSAGETATRRAWSSLKAKHAATLGPLTPRVDTITRDGVKLWRLQAGPLDLAQARAACEKLKAAGDACAVVSP